MKNTEVIKIDDKENVLAFINDPVKLGEILTGILASEKKEWLLSAGKVFQASLKFKLLTQLGRELKEYREKGKIKEDYFATNNNQASFNDLLSFIDEEVPDEERMKAMKSIFLSSISTDVTEEDEKLAYEFMQICKKLSSGDILVLKANFELVTGKARHGITVDPNFSGSADGWLDVIAKQIGHNLPNLVEAYEENLMNLKLVSKRVYGDLSGYRATPHFRLTTFGYKLCEFITRYP